MKLVIATTVLALIVATAAQTCSSSGWKCSGSQAYRCSYSCRYVSGRSTCSYKPTTYEYCPNGCRTGTGCLAEQCGLVRAGSFCSTPLGSGFRTPQSNAQSTSLEAAAADFFYDMANITLSGDSNSTTTFSSGFNSANSALLQRWACSGTYWQCGACGRSDCFIYDQCIADCNAAGAAVNATGNAAFVAAYNTYVGIPVDYPNCQVWCSSASAVATSMALLLILLALALFL